MTNVIQTNQDSMYLMGQLNRATKWCREQNDPLFEESIRRQKKMLKEEMDKVLGKC